MAKKVIVVHVGEHEVQIVHMENTDSNPTVYGCVRFPTPENCVQDGMIVDVAEIAVRIHKACEEKGIRTKDVVFTVASNKIASRETSIPVVNKAKIQPLVMAKVPDLFPIDAEKYLFSHVLQGAPREDENGEKTQDVMVFAAPSDLIDSYYTLADAAGLHIVSIEAQGNAVFQIMKRQAKCNVSMSVQINDTTTLVNIISGQKLLLQRVIPYGVNVFTEIMMQEPAFQTPTEEKAYTLLKRNRVLLPSMGEQNPTQDASLAKRIEVTENAAYLLGNITRVIEYYNTRYKEQPIEEIICMGQGCAIAGIHELLTNELGIQAYTPEELLGIRFSRLITINAYILQYVNCFGSVFDSVNFVSRAIAQRAEKKGSLTSAILVFVGCVAISIVLAGLSILQLMDAQTENERMTVRESAMDEIQAEYNELLALEKNHELLASIDRFTTTNNNGFHDLLKEIESYCPHTFKIQSIKTDELEVQVSATSTDKLLSLSALQIQLNKINKIENVKIDSITRTKESVTKRKQYAYTISFNYRAEVASKEEGGKE